VRCDTFITESTFGLPIYRWTSPQAVLADVAQWWRGNADASRVSIVYAYAFGKAQRILAGLAEAAATDIGPIVCHGAVEVLNEAYRRSGVALPATLRADDADPQALHRALVLAPPSAAGTPWLRRFAKTSGGMSDAFASGWMRLRGARRRRALDRGFVLSDHADWPGLNAAIAATGASRVIVTHGHVPVMVRWLAERGLEASSFATEYDEDAAEAGA
jgi:putative mRNA 3-end processing factor